MIKRIAALCVAAYAIRSSNDFIAKIGEVVAICEFVYVDNNFDAKDHNNFQDIVHDIAAAILVRMNGPQCINFKDFTGIKSRVNTLIASFRVPA